MKKVVKLSESDIARIVNKVINEQPEINRTGDLYDAVNSLIDDEYNDVDYEDVANVLENILRGIKAQSYRNKKGIKPISSAEVLKNFGLNEQVIDGIAYSVVKTPTGKFRIFVVTPKYKKPTDASTVFGKSTSWKDYDTKQDAKNLINSLMKKNEVLSANKKTFKRQNIN